MSDIRLNPPGIKPYPVKSAFSTGTGCTYGKIVVADNGTNNNADVKLATAAKEQSVVGPVTTRNAAGSASEALEVGQDGAVCEVWLAAGETCAKEGEAVCSADDGDTKPIGSNTGALDVIGRYKQNATAGGSPILVALEVGVYSKVVA